MRVVPSEIFNGYESEAIGTRIKNRGRFNEILLTALEEETFNEGKKVINLNEYGDVCSTVLGGVGDHTHQVEDYVLRKHRGRVKRFLKRSKANDVVTVSAVVYTKEAYLDDPDVDSNELERIQRIDPDYVLVALLASDDKDSESPMTPGRLLHNLADEQEWTAPEIRHRVRKSLEYYDEKCVVAD